MFRPAYSFVHSPQIGNRFALTAAHCLYDDDNEEVLPASSFSLMLGLHDRRKTTELKRLLFNSPYYDHDLHCNALDRAVAQLSIMVIGARVRKQGTG